VNTSINAFSDRITFDDQALILPSFQALFLGDALLPIHIRLPQRPRADNPCQFRTMAKVVAVQNIFLTPLFSSGDCSANMALVL